MQPKAHFVRLIDFYRQRFAHYGHGTPEPAIVRLGAQVFLRPNSQDAVREFRPYFDKPATAERESAELEGSRG